MKIPAFSLSLTSLYSIEASSHSSLSFKPILLSLSSLSVTMLLSPEINIPKLLYFITDVLILLKSSRDWYEILLYDNLRSKNSPSPPST